MPENRTTSPDFNRAFGDAKKEAANVAGEVRDAADDLYGQARERSAFYLLMEFGVLQLSKRLSYPAYR
jgi:hypothetical protein